MCRAATAFPDPSNLCNRLSLLLQLFRREAIHPVPIEIAATLGSSGERVPTNGQGNEWDLLRLRSGV